MYILVLPGQLSKQNCCRTLSDFTFEKRELVVLEAFLLKKKRQILKDLGKDSLLEESETVLIGVQNIKSKVFQPESRLWLKNVA